MQNDGALGVVLGFGGPGSVGNSSFQRENLKEQNKYQRERETNQKPTSKLFLACNHVSCSYLAKLGPCGNI